MLLTTRDLAGASIAFSTPLGSTASWGIRAFIVKQDGTIIEITEGTPIAVVSRNADGSGYQSADWNCPETSLDLTDAVLVQVYRQHNGGTWTLLVEFITEQLNATRLLNAVWTVVYYTAYNTGASTVSASYLIGGYDSCIKNFTTELPPLKCTLIIESAPGGSTTPYGTRTYDLGTKVGVQAIPSSGYKFDHWELDGAVWGNMAIGYWVTMDADHHLLAVFSEFPLPLREYASLDETGYLGLCRLTYSDAWNSPTGMVFDGRTPEYSQWLVIGQHSKEGYYCLDRTVLFIDTRDIPLGAIITRAVLKSVVQTFNVLPREEVGGYCHFNVVVQRSTDPAYPHAPLVAIDYDRTKYAGNLGQLNTDQMPVEAVVYIELNADGIAQINKGGITKLILRGDQEISGTYIPFGGLIYFFSPRTVAVQDRPSLYVEYEVPKHTLIITATAGGTTDPTPATYEYDEGSIASVSAIPDSGYMFDHWELDGTPIFALNPVNITMDADHTLLAVFTAEGIPTPTPPINLASVSFGALLLFDAALITYYGITHIEDVRRFLVGLGRG